MNRAALLMLALTTTYAAEIPGLPPPAEPRPLKILVPHERTLENGLRVLVVERPGVPLVSAELVVRSGSECDPPTLAGLMSFTAGLLTQGTTTRSAPELAQQIEALGATLTAESGWDATRVELTTLSAQTGPALELLADVVRRPKFDRKEIDRHRRQELDDLRLALEEPAEVARAVARRLALGESPYAHPTDGTLASLPRITRAEIVALHARTFVPSNALLILAGKITAEESWALVEKTFGDWKGAAPAPEPPAAPAGPVPPRAVLIDLPDAGQAAVYVARAGLPRTHPAFPAGEVANAILGGGYSSHLNQEIRVNRGLSYGAQSVLSAGRGSGLFAAGCQTKNESAVKVVAVIRDQLDRLAAAPAAAAYFASRQAVLRGDFARELETNAGWVAAVAEHAGFGLPLSALANRVAAIEAVTAEQARAFAAAHLATASMSVVVVGRAQDIEKPLRALLPALEVIPHSQLDLDQPSLRAQPPR
jgi:zinc protease